MKTTAKITAMLLVLALMSPASAEVITVQVTGVVDYFSTGGELAMDGSVGLGSTMTGFCTYDTETPDEFPVNEDLGFYPVILISMTIGNYTFSQDVTSPDLPYFQVSSAVDPGYFVSSDASRFDGTVYINGSPKTYEDITWNWTYLALLVLVTSSSEYIPTDALPDLASWPDISVFDMGRDFETRFDGEGDDYFHMYGEITSLTVIPEPAKTYYVNATDGDDNNNGLSKETAFATIQKAIDSAYNGDTVLVADGTYTGPGNRDIDFLGKAITVRSESGPENCIIDCNGTETDPHRGFYFHSGEDANSVLDGFTITNGYADLGGGIFCSHSSPTITNSIINNNSGRNGGGGICCFYPSSNPNIISCTVRGNTSIEGGGGIHCWESNAIIKSCSIRENFARDHGGGIDSYHSNLTIANCTISANTTVCEGGGIYCRNGTTKVTNCTITGNLANRGGGIYFENQGSSIIANCIIWQNTANYEGQLYESSTPSYSCIQDWAGMGSGNIDADPYFVQPGYWDTNNTPDDANDDSWVEGDYHLLLNSPCIDAGDPYYVLEPNETDLDGNPRVIGDAIDMGAYESNYIEAEMKFTPQTLNCNSKGKYIKAHITLPEGFLPEDVDVNESAWAEPMGAESEYIKVLGAGTGPVKLEICFDRDAFCDELIETGEVEITVIGSLTTGRYFYATDTIKIKPRCQ